MAVQYHHHRDGALIALLRSLLPICTRTRTSIFAFLQIFMGAMLVLWKRHTVSGVLGTH